MSLSPYCKSGSLLFMLLVNMSLLHLDSFQVDAADTDIVINEIMYNPADTNTGDEYIELYNKGGTQVDLSGWVLESAVTFTFPANTFLNSGSYLVVCADQAIAQTFYGINNTIGNYSGRLDNGGETIVLRNDETVIIDHVTYNDRWPWWSEADGAGPSLELINPNYDNNDSASWEIGSDYSPGAVNSPITPQVGNIVITEIMYHPEPDTIGAEYIELYNRSGVSVSLNGWQITNGVTFTFPDISLAPDDYIVVVGNESNAMTIYGLAANDIAGQYSLGDLSNGGELIAIKDSGGNIIDAVNYNDGGSWPTEADGGGASLELFVMSSENNNPANWGVGQPHTPAAANNPVASGGGDIVITEIMYHPLKKRFMENLDPSHGGYWWEDGDDPLGQYVELFNRGALPVDLSNWSFVDGISYTFPPGTTLNSGEYLVVCYDADSIADNYGITNTIGNFIGSLSNDGERITLVNAVGAVMDTVKYNDLPPWPIGPDQEGQSLECLDPLSNNDIPENWRACRVPEQDNPELVWEPGVSAEWTYYEVSCNATSNRFYFYLNGPGEWLVDEIKVFAASDPTKDVMENGTFYTNDYGWEKTGNHAGTYYTGEDHDGNGGEHIVSTGIGGSSTNSLNRYVSWVTAGQDYTISFWAKCISGNSSLTFRLSGGGCFIEANVPTGGDEHPCQSPLLYFVGTETFVTRGTPGAANTISSVGLPPFVDVDEIVHMPLKPSSGDTVTVTAEVDSEDSISSVTLDYEIYVADYNEPSAVHSIPMYDDGAHGDGLAGDDIYGAEIGPQPSRTLVRYRITATDTSARSWTWPDDEEPNPNGAYFVYDGEEETKLDAFFMVMNQQNLDWLAATVNMYDNDPWNPEFKRYAKAAVVIEGIVYDNIRARYRADRNWAKHAYKLKFNKNEYFNNMSTLDTDFQWPIAQDVASNMFALVGQENIALVPIRFYLNGDFAGILVLQESPNSSWLRKMGLNEDSEIYKSKSSGGCCSGFLPCNCIPSVCWCSIGSSCTSNLGYYSNYDYYPRMYIKRSDALGSFQSLQDFTWDLQSADDNYLYFYTEAFNWIYKTVIHAVHGHLDYHAKNHYIVRSPDPGAKWDVFYFDYDMFWGCKMWGGNCYPYDANPKGSGTVMQSRIYASPYYNNMFLLILKDVAENILTEEVVSDMLDEAFADTAVDRQEEIDTVDGATVVTDINMAAMKQHFIDRRNWLLNTYLPSQSMTPLANEHPYINVDDPNIISENEVIISWTWSDAEEDASVVDLYWTDLGFNHFVPIPDGNDLPAGAEGHGEFTWTQAVPDMTEDRIYIHAVIRDGNGLLVGRSTSGFIVPIPVEPIPGDVDDSGQVDITDLLLMAASWLDPPEYEDPGEMQMWDVAADYSLIDNPNGPWSYMNSAGELLNYTSSITYTPDHEGWESPGGSPCFYNGPWLFAAADEMVSHGPLMIRWTSPMLGDIEISGSGLAPDWELSRLMHWQWRKNNVVLTEGDFPPNYSVVDFTGGTNGPTALTQSVLPGDNIDFVCTGSGPVSTSTFFSFKFQIEQLSGLITEIAPPELDLVPDNRINLLDFAVLADHWMETAE